MVIYYDIENNICISLSGLMNDEPDVKISINEASIVLKAGDTEQEFERGLGVSAIQVGTELVIDFSPESEELSGLELSAVGEVDEISVVKDGEVIAEITDEGVVVPEPKPEPEPDPEPEPEPEPDPEKEADEEAVAQGKHCKIGTEYFDTLKEAVATAQPNEAITIKMLADEDGAGIGLFTADGQENLDITIDFNGHTYTASSPAVGSSQTQTQALHLEMNNKVTLKNGAFTSDRSASDIKMLIQNYCNLTLDNMVCDCADDSSITYVVSNNFGNCLIKNSEIKAHPSRVAVDCCFGLLKLYDSGLTVTINNCNIDSKIEYGAQKAALSRTGNEEWWKKAVLTINNSQFGSIVNSGQASEQEHHTIIIDGEESDFIPAE